MTFADDFLDEQGLENDYPSAFGITFTPVVMGITFAVIGVVGAGYIYTKFAGEAKTKYQGVQTQLDQKQAQLDQMKQEDFPAKMANLQAEVARQKALKSRVTAMFTNQDDLETLLIDLNQFIRANQGELVKYDPDSQISVINDSSLGNEVNGKLKRKSFALDIEGTFNQTQAILQDIERLQPLLMVQDYKSNVTEDPTAILTSNRQEVVPQNSAILSTSLKIDAILPLSQKELEAARQAEENVEDKDAKGRERKSRR